MISEEDLAAIEDRAQRANSVRVSGSYQEMGVIASVVREDVPALVAEVRAFKNDYPSLVADACRANQAEGRLMECANAAIDAGRKLEQLRDAAKALLNECARMPDRSADPGKHRWRLWGEEIDKAFDRLNACLHG